MGDGHNCSCAEPQRIETHDLRIVCAECGGTVRENKESKDDRRERDTGQG